MGKLEVIISKVLTALWKPTAISLYEEKKSIVLDQTTAIIVELIKQELQISPNINGLMSFAIHVISRNHKILPPSVCATWKHYERLERITMNEH